MKPETRNTFKENVLLALSYILSKILQFLFKCNVYIFGLAEGCDDITTPSVKTKRWTHRNPFSGRIDPKWYSTYYFDDVNFLWDKVRGRYKYGRFSHAIKAVFGVDKAFWMLEMDHGKLQEIDVVEFMKPHGKRGVYFSIYNNEISNRYYADDDESKIIYRRFQTRMRSRLIMDYIETLKVNYSIRWHKKYVVWYIEDMPVAISFVYIPTQPMYIILSNV